MDFPISLKTIYQAIMFGVVTILIGLILCSVFSSLKPELPKECDVWDKYYVMEIILFLTGVIIRLLMINKTVVKYLYEE